MLKNILKLEGAQKLSNNEQKSINGGRRIYALCPPEEPVCSEGDSNCQALIDYTICVNR